MVNKKLNLFQGGEALLDFMNPANNPYTPMVEIPSSLNPFAKSGVRIFAKMMNAVPLSNIKALPAYQMLKDDEGGNKDTIIENSSGNTVLSLAVIGRLFGYQETKAVVSHEVSPGKLKLLRFLGVKPIVNEEPICPDPSDKNSGIYKAKKWAKENGWLNPGQYDNQSNPKAHYLYTGPQIYEQLDGRLDYLSVGLGTTGSVVGLKDFFYEKKLPVKIIGVSRLANNAVPGVRTQNLLQEVSFDWKKDLYSLVEVGSVDSYRLSLELCRLGLMVGPSSGFALAGLIECLKKEDLSDGKEKVAVFVCPDSPFPYIDEYFSYLEDECFPEIDNVELLKKNNKTDEFLVQEVKEVEPLDMFNKVFSVSLEIGWEKIKNEGSLDPKIDFAIIDLRTSFEFEDHHIPGAVNVGLSELSEYLNQNYDQYSNKELFFVCRRGNASKEASMTAERLGLKAFSLRGGDTEWSRLNFPRIRSEKCVKRFGL